MPPSLEQPPEQKRAPLPKASPTQSAPPKHKQHGCLVIWLIGLVLFGVYSAYLWTTLMPDLEQQYSTFQVYAVLAVMLAQILAALGILMRKRRSVFILITALVADFVLRLSMDILDQSSLVVIGLTVVILWGFVRPNWAYYS